MAKKNEVVTEVTEEAVAVATEEAVAEKKAVGKMVTRTITTTKLEVMVVDITRGETATEVVEVAGKIEGDKALKVAKKKLETEAVKVVAIVGSDLIEKLYGIPEDDFIKYAVELNPETRKAL